MPCTLAGSADRPFTPTPGHSNMRGLLRALLAGWAAKKWGGGCLGTIIVFLIVFWLLSYVL